MAAFQNHRIFTLRCLKEDLIPVSVKLRSNFKTPRAKNIIKRAERALLNERVRNIKQYHHHGNMQKGYMYEYPFRGLIQGNHGRMC